MEIQKTLTGKTIESKKIEKEAWNQVNEAISKNRKNRINWKSLIGESLNTFIYRNSNQTPEQIYNYLIKNYDFSEEMKRRLKINLSACYTYLKKKRG